MSEKTEQPAVGERERYEAFISSSPFERDIARFPDDPTKYAWPGNYRDLQTDMGWHVWQEASAENTALRARVAELERDAARYRWLRKNGDLQPAYVAQEHGVGLDYLIDTVLGASEQEPRDHT